MDNRFNQSFLLFGVLKRDRGGNVRSEKPCKDNFSAQMHKGKTSKVKKYTKYKNRKKEKSLRR